MQRNRPPSPQAINVLRALARSPASASPGSPPSPPASIGGGGPPDADGGFTLRGTISDRIGGNLVLLGFTIVVFATIGWGGAAAAGRLLRRAVPPQEA